MLDGIAVLLAVDFNDGAFTGERRHTFAIGFFKALQIVERQAAFTTTGTRFCSFKAYLRTHAKP